MKQPMSTLACAAPVLPGAVVPALAQGRARGRLHVDASYFLTPNRAAELVLTYPQRHDVALDGRRLAHDNVDYRSRRT